MIWNRRSVAACAVIAGVASLEVLYGCAGESGVEDFVEQHIGEVAEPIVDTDPCWLPAPHPAGLAWTWCQDRNLVVALASDSSPVPWTRGVYFIYAGRVTASWNPTGGSFWPLLLVVPHPAGAVLSRQTSLNLRVLGSSEHITSCPSCVGYDDVTVRIAPERIAETIRFTVVVDGIAYLGLPRVGSASIQYAGGTTTVDLADVYATASTTYYDDMTSMSITGSLYGPLLSLVEATPLPTMQVQGDAGMGVEGDMDHSYLVSASFPKPHLTMTFKIPAPLYPGY